MTSNNILVKQLTPTEGEEKAEFAAKEEITGTWYCAWVVFFEEGNPDPSVIKFEANVGMCCTFQIVSMNDFEQLRDAVVEKAREVARTAGNPVAESEMVSIRSLSRL